MRQRFTPAITKKIAYIRCAWSINLFNLANPSSLTMAVELTQPQTETITRNLLGGKARLARKAKNVTGICEPTV
jgi:hypothetical protein